MEPRSFRSRTLFIGCIALVFAFGLLAGLRHQSSLAAPLTPAVARAIGVTQLFHPAFVKSSFGYNSTLYVQNLAAASANLALAFSGGVNSTHVVPAGGTLILPAADIAALPSGFNGTLVVSSDQPILSLVREVGSTGEDPLTVARGIASGSTNAFYGPIYKNSNSVNSALRLLNVGANTTSVQAQFISASGSIAGSQALTIAPGQAGIILTQNVAALPDGFVGWVAVQSSAAPLAGLLLNSGPVLRQYLEPLPIATAATSQYLPRALKAFDEGGGARTSLILVGNAGSAAANVAVTYSDAAGAVVTSSVLTIAAGGMTLIDLAQVAGVSAGSAVAVRIDGDQPLLVAEQTDYDGPTAFSSNADAYAGTSDALLTALPFLQRSPAAYSVLSLLNTSASAATVTVSYYSPAGAVVHTQNLTLPAAGWARLNQSQIVQLGDSFEGSAVVSSDQALLALVDLYVVGVDTPTPTVATSTPTSTPTSTLVPTATSIPTPTPGGVAALLYINYASGAPGSVFLISGQNFPPNQSVSIAVNGTTIGTGVVADGAGSFSLLLDTSTNAGDGFYVITAVSTASARLGPSQAEAASGAQNYYQLSSTGPDAILRTAPPDVPATTLSVPATVPALDERPFVAMPLVLR